MLFCGGGKTSSQVLHSRGEGQGQHVPETMSPSSTATEGNPAVSKALFPITEGGDLWGQNRKADPASTWESSVAPHSGKQ